jgi:hypothetical protein
MRIGINVQVAGPRPCQETFKTVAGYHIFGHVETYGTRISRAASARNPSARRDCGLLFATTSWMSVAITIGKMQVQSGNGTTTKLNGKRRQSI